MVMEAPPSPQSVGREFVRQYYTLLNKAPTHLHRFYNQQSSFVHGGLDPPNRETIPVIGQKQIHQKIQQLNFLDCHAKITQVDSQATLGNGVVVQVTGELSNAGQPMRRFTQTFVLAAQSPKKYYVHNDIFRYQDEIISDEECDNENRSEPEEDINQDHQQTISSGDIPNISQQPMPFYPSAAAPLQPPAIPAVPMHHSQPPLNVLPPQPPVPTVVNGAIHPDEMSVMPGQVPQHVPSGQALGNALNAIQPGLVPPHVNPSAPVEENPQPIEEPVEEPVETNYVEPQEQEIEQQEPVPEPISNEPKTYANLLKSGNNTGYSNTLQNQSYNQSSSVQSGPRSLSPQNNAGGIPGMNQRNSLNRGNRMNQQRLPRQDSLRGPPRNSTSEEDDRRRSQNNNYGDINQLFLGNLPQMATEEELRDIFCQFGTILDLRVHSKPGNKNGPPGSRPPPNYGFITYETQICVQNCLAAKPIFYPKDDKNGTQLNVEEKKNKDRPPFGGNRPIDNRPRDNLQRRGPGGPGPNRNNTNGGPTGGSVTRNNNYNRNGGPPNRGPNSYTNRR